MNYGHFLLWRNVNSSASGPRVLSHGHDLRLWLIFISVLRHKICIKGRWKSEWKRKKRHVQCCPEESARAKCGGETWNEEIKKLIEVRNIAVVESVGEVSANAGSLECQLAISSKPFSSLAFLCLTSFATRLDPGICSRFGGNRHNRTIDHSEISSREIK